MKTRTGSLALAAGAAAIIAACSSTEGDSPAVSPSGSASVTATSSGTTSAPTVAPASVGPTGSTTATTSSGGTGGSTSSGTGGTGSSAPSCPAPPATLPEVMLGGVYDYGDEKTTRNFTQPMPNVLCLDGTAYPAADEATMNDYAFWGAGIGLQVAMDATTPYDAAAAGIAGVKFDITEWAERPVRVQMSQVNDPAIPEDAMNFQNNGFVYGGSSPKATKANATLTIMFEDFKLPSWTEIPDANQGPLDATKLHSLQIQIASEPDDPEVAYKFCITNLQWLDACEQPIAATTLPPPEADSSNSTDDTGSGSTDSGSAGSGSDTSGSDTSGSDTGSGSTDSASTSGGSDSASSGSDSTSAATLSYATDIQPIFAAKCATCHGENSWYGTGTEEPTNKAAIADRIQREEGAQGKMPQNGTLTEDEIATIVAWTEQ